MWDAIDIKECLRGLDAEFRKAKFGDIYVSVNSRFDLELRVGSSRTETWVLTPDASKTLLKRLDAEFRVPSMGDRYLGYDGTWSSADCAWTTPRICEKKPMSKFRVLEAGEPAMPGDLLLDRNRNIIGEAYNVYTHTYPNVQNPKNPAYGRKPWTRGEYRERQAEWVNFHNLKEGDTVKVCCKAKTDRDGWGDGFVVEMEDAIGKEFTVYAVEQSGIAINAPEQIYNRCRFPFYVLQVVKKPKPVKPEPKYREFKNPLEVADWIRQHGSKIVSSTFYGDVDTARMELGTTLINGSLYSNFRDCKSTKDGTPFGVLE